MHLHYGTLSLVVFFSRTKVPYALPKTFSSHHLLSLFQSKLAAFTSSFITNKTPSACTSITCAMASSDLDRLEGSIMFKRGAKDELLPTMLGHKRPRRAQTKFFDLPRELRDMVYLVAFKAHSQPPCWCDGARYSFNMPGFRLLALDPSDVFGHPHITLNRTFPRWTAVCMNFQEEVTEAFAKHFVFQVASGYSSTLPQVENKTSFESCNSSSSKTRHMRPATQERKIVDHRNRVLLRSIRNIKLPIFANANQTLSQGWNLKHESGDSSALAAFLAIRGQSPIPHLFLE